MIYPSKEFLKVFKETPGALSVTESVAIMNIAAQAPKGIYIELGTHKGKSAMSAFHSLPDGVFYLVDPIFSDIEILKEVYDQLNKKPMLLPMLSTEAITYPFNGGEPTYTGYAYVFVDSGSHQDGLPMQEAKLLEDRVVSGGIIAWHDFKNQFREPAEAADYLVSTGKYEWIDIPWQEIISYVKENNLEEGNNSWHVYDDVPFPNFVGAVRRK